MRGKVDRVEPSLPGWVWVVLEAGPSLSVHTNWFNENGELKHGDAVEYDEGPHHNLRRAPKEAKIE